MFIYFILTVLGLLCCVGSSLVAVIGGYSSLLCAGFSLRWLFLLWSMGSVVVAYGLSCSTACGIFLDQGLNSCLLHWQSNSLTLSHQGSPKIYFFFFYYVQFCVLTHVTEQLHCPEKLRYPSLVKPSSHDQSSVSHHCKFAFGAT